MGPREALVGCKQVGIARRVSGGSQPRGLQSPHNREPDCTVPELPAGQSYPRSRELCPKRQRAFEGFPPSL